MTPDKIKALTQGFVKRMQASGVTAVACAQMGDGKGTFQAYAGVADLRVMLAELIRGMTVAAADDDLCPACTQDLQRLRSALLALQAGPDHQHLH